MLKWAGIVSFAILVLQETILRQRPFFMILAQLLFQMLTTIQPVLFYHLKTGK